MSSDFRSINQSLSNTMVVDGKTYLYFGGTAYLGIPKNADFIDLYMEGIQKFGLNNGTSRNNNVQLGIYDEAEKVAAKRFLAEDALITSSGFLAAQLTIKKLAAFGEVIYAPSTHPALWIDDQPATYATTFTDWKTATTESINSSSETHYVLISNSMNNLFPEIYNFDFLRNIHSDKNILLIVDDSHGIGVNNCGLGAFKMLPKLKNVNCVAVASMAKALGVDAGLVLGPKNIIQELRRTNIFVGASPPSAACIYAFIHGDEIYRKALEKLQQNMIHFTEALDLSWTFEQKFPAYFLNQPDLGNRLRKENILISSFPYPASGSELINRIVLSSWHQPEDINQLIIALAILNQ